MISKLLFHTRLLIYVLLLADIVFAIVSFLNDFSSLVIFIYVIASSLIYIFLFSINKNSTKREYKFYAIISLISFCLFTYITFGPYFGFTGFIAVPTMLYALVTYVYYFLCNKCNQKYLVILINTLYMIIKAGLIFTLIVATSLIGLGV
jgi:hypothetical protein